MFLDLLRSIYLKEKVPVSVETGTCIVLNNVLSKQKDNLEALSKIVDYTFSISPRHYFYLLFFSIPRKNYIPKNTKFEKKEIKIDKNLKEEYEWSDREYKLNF